MDWNLIERLFSDCNVVEIDLSEWDRGMSMLVIADHLPHEGGRRPAVLITFRPVYELAIQFRHMEYIPPEPSQHVQWQVDTLVQHEPCSGGRFRMELSGLVATPVMTLEFDEAEVSIMSLRALDERFPNWEAPGGPFVRPALKRTLDT